MSRLCKESGGMMDRLLVAPSGQRSISQDRWLKTYQIGGQTIVYNQLLVWLHVIKPT